MLDIFDLPYNVIGAFVPDSATFGPSSMDIGHNEAPDEVTCKAVAAVSDRIGFHETGAGNVPIVSADGDLVTQH